MRSNDEIWSRFIFTQKTLIRTPAVRVTGIKNALTTWQASLAAQDCVRVSLGGLLLSLRRLPRAWLGIFVGGGLAIQLQYPLAARTGLRCLKASAGLPPRPTSHHHCSTCEGGVECVHVGDKTREKERVQCSKTPVSVQGKPPTAF